MGCLLILSHSCPNLQEEKHVRRPFAFRHDSVDAVLEGNAGVLDTRLREIFSFQEKRGSVIFFTFFLLPKDSRSQLFQQSLSAHFVKSNLLKVENWRQTNILPLLCFVVLLLSGGPR